MSSCYLDALKCRVLWDCELLVLYQIYDKRALAYGHEMVTRKLFGSHYYHNAVSPLVAQQQLENKKPVDGIMTFMAYDLCHCGPYYHDGIKGTIFASQQCSWFGSPQTLLVLVDITTHHCPSHIISSRIIYN